MAVVVWGLVEAALVVLLAVRLRRFVRETRAHRRQGASLVGALEPALAGALGSRVLAAILAGEVTVLVYAVGGWFRPTPPPDASRFSMHRERRWGTIVGVLAFLVAVETAGLHVALSFWSVPAAWISTALSIYAVMWIVGDFHALRLHPLVLGADAVELEVGVRWRLRVPYADVVAAEPLDARPARASDLLVAGVMAPNVLLSLGREVVAAGPFALRRRARRIALTVDRREAFLAALTRRAPR